MTNVKEADSARAVYPVKVVNNFHLFVCKIIVFVFQIDWGACALVLAGDLVVFLTILGYFFVFGNEDMDYSSW